MYRKVRVKNNRKDRPYSRGKVRLKADSEGVFVVGYRTYIGLRTSQSVDVEVLAEGEDQPHQPPEEEPEETDSEEDAEEDEPAPEEEEEQEVATAEEYPRYTGGGYYELSNGEKIQGKEEAMEAQAELEKDD